jgi:hypothetical protein
MDNFRLIRSQFDWSSGRAYVELRAPDGKTDAIVTLIFTMRPSPGRSAKRVEDDILRRARSLLTKAVASEI